jgi:hypothetical protein
MGGYSLDVAAQENLTSESMVIHLAMVSTAVNPLEEALSVIIKTVNALQPSSLASSDLIASQTSQHVISSYCIAQSQKGTLQY